ncbi:hypothetical protein Patl1_09596 [Pistacia atlantica]|uniref:Uncharacterized protein n=1 Tax=Pistacia atlantica TaxID=434234 RepID=A0ACC1A669_9ROSI|nr:hypothetical protein Patl1_09596 [Pistacia atlantica]
MEAVTGEQPNGFQQQITPFPESLDLTSALESAKYEPPQKLRPIRRSPAEDPSSFLAEHLCAGGTGESTALYETEKVEMENGKGIHFWIISNVKKQGEWGKREFGGHLVVIWIFELILSACHDSLRSSSSADDGDNFLANSKEPGMRKRKRKTMIKIESILEGLAMRIMEKQEQMHKQLIELVEKRERERIIREEAWKQQEMERMKREEEMRTQEMSRSIALISFIQNVLGHEIQIPQPGPVSFVEESETKDVGNHTENDIMCDSNNRRWSEACDSSRRWPEAEVQALITLRTASEHKFHLMGSKCSIWDEISVGMRNMGYDRSAKKCKEKWENMNKYFRKSMGNGKKHPENSKTCPYFHDLYILYRNGLLTPGNAGLVTPGDAANFINYDNVPKIEKE